MKDLMLFEKVFKCPNLLTAYNDMQIRKGLVFRSLKPAKHERPGSQFILFLLMQKAEPQALSVLSRRPAAASEAYPVSRVNSLFKLQLG